MPPLTHHEYVSTVTRIAHLVSESRFDESLSLVDKLLASDQLQPIDRCFMLINRATVLDSKGLPQDAERALEEAIALEIPLLRTNARIRKIQRLRSQQRYEEALATCDEILALHIFDAVTRNELEELKSAIASDSTAGTYPSSSVQSAVSASPPLQRSDSHLQPTERNTPEAMGMTIEEYHQQLQVFGQQFESGQAELALSTIEKILSDAPIQPLDRCFVLINRGMVYDRLGRSTDAETSFEAAIAIERQIMRCNARLQKAWWYASQGRFSEALSCCDELLAMNVHSWTNRSTIERVRAEIASGNVPAPGGFMLNEPA